MKKRNFPIYLSLLFLALLAACTAINFLYINNVGNTLEEMTVRAETADDAQALREYWHSQIDRVSISVSNSAVGRLTDAIDTLVCYMETGHDMELGASVAAVVNAIDGVRRLERISARNIF